MERIGVMQITDTLAAGGLEKMAVNLANHLPSTDYRSHICATRETGPLQNEIAPNVRQLHLRRSGTFDFSAIRKLQRYIAENDIQILHAHGTSLFIAAAAVSCCRKKIKLLWHDHFGRFETQTRPKKIYATAARAVDGVLSVTEPLANWAREALQIPSNRVWYIPNFSALNGKNAETTPRLPGTKGFRVVCVANLRPEKDHVTLLRAFELVTRKIPQAHLILLGAGENSDHAQFVQHTIRRLSLDQNVTWLGSRSDVSAILRHCDVGILSSASEGLPLALIEYGLAGLPVIATNVGQCAEVLERGAAGLLVPPCSPESLAHALLVFLGTKAVRQDFAARFSGRVQATYSAAAAMRQVCEIYRVVLSEKSLA